MHKQILIKPLHAIGDGKLNSKKIPNSSAEDEEIKKSEVTTNLS